MLNVNVCRYFLKLQAKHGLLFFSALTLYFLVETPTICAHSSFLSITSFFFQGFEIYIDLEIVVFLIVSENLSVLRLCDLIHWFMLGASPWQGIFNILVYSIKIVQKFLFGSNQFCWQNTHLKFHLPTVIRSITHQLVGYPMFLQVWMIYNIWCYNNDKSTKNWLLFSYLNTSEFSIVTMWHFDSFYCLTVFRRSNKFNNEFVNAEWNTFQISNMLLIPS